MSLLWVKTMLGDEEITDILLDTDNESQMNYFNVSCQNVLESWNPHVTLHVIELAMVDSWNIVPNAPMSKEEFEEENG